MAEPIIPGGCFLVSRKLNNSVIMNKPPEYLKVWIYLLSNAFHSDKGNLKRGQGYTSLPILMDMLSYNVGYRVEKPTKKKVYGIIEWLRNPHEGEMKVPMIVTTKVTHGFVYTIVNYDLYQDMSNYEGNSEGTTKEQRRVQKGNNINKNVKNEKNEKNEKNIEPIVSTEVETRKFEDDSFEMTLVNHFILHLEEQIPNFKTPNKEKWAYEIDKMIRIDKRTEEEIIQVLKFAITDSFWKLNILSTSKLRKQYDQLYLRMKSTSNRKEVNTEWITD